MQAKERDVEFDLLRAMIILSALFLHFHTNFNIETIITPFWFMQMKLLTVGGFFFFTAGYMARKIYYKKFLQKNGEVAKRLVFKGVSILIIYIAFVLFMHISTGTNIPDNAEGFIFNHRFFTKILFTFSLLFIITPVILFIATRYEKSLLVFFLVIIALVYLYNQEWVSSLLVKKLLFDRKEFLYPLMPALAVYLSGYYFAFYETNIIHKVSLEKLAVICILILAMHYLLLDNSYTYNKLATDKQNITFIEMFSPALLVFIARYVLLYERVKKYLSSKYVLCIGILSLHFYVFSNVLIGLVPVSVTSDVWFKMIVLLLIATVTYIFVYWRYRNRPE